VYGANEATTANMRLVAADLNKNKGNDQFTGLMLTGEKAALTTWTAENNKFTLPEEVWQGVALSSSDCKQKGGCLPNEMPGCATVYPNPSNGLFTIEIPKTNNDLVSVKISDVLGRQVLNIQAQSGQLLPVNLSDFKMGTYVVQITGSDINLKQNIVIQ
jgi:hypothetical protein